MKLLGQLLIIVIIVSANGIVSRSQLSSFEKFSVDQVPAWDIDNNALGEIAASSFGTGPFEIVGFRNSYPRVIHPVHGEIFVAYWAVPAEKIPCPKVDLPRGDSSKSKAQAGNSRECSE